MLFIVLVALPAAACSKSSTVGADGAVPLASASHVPASSSSEPRGDTIATDTFQSSQGPIAIHPINHASFLIQFAGKAVYVDPTKNGSVAALPKATHILLTHSHYDHFDQEGISRVRTSSTLLIGPPILADKLPNLVVIRNGETKNIDGMQLDAVPMYNIQRGPSAGKLYHDKGQGNGYVIGLADKRIYVSGDTECIPEIRELKRVDIAFLCMNLPYTMPVEEAARCVTQFRPAVVFPYHSKGSDLGQFQKSLASEPGTEVRIRNWY